MVEQASLKPNTPNPYPHVADPSPVEACLLALLASRHRAEAWKTVQKLVTVRGFDWEALYKIAKREALLPLLCDIVRDRGLVPVELEDRWRAYYASSLRRNWRLLAELEEAIAALTAAKITPILLKGAALIQTVYADPALRPMTDLDLLVHREQVADALHVLAAKGYRPVRPEARVGLTIEVENEVMIQKPDASSVPLELHWSLFDSPHHQRRLAEEWWWQSALPVRGALPGAHILGPEAQVLHLCAHLALHHRGRGLLWLHDIAEILYYYQDRLNWELLLTKATEYDLLLPLQQTLPRVAENWSAPIPAGIRLRLQELTPSPEEVGTFKRLTADERPAVRRFWDDLMAMRGWRQRLRYGLSNLFPSPIYMRQRYRLRHSALLPLAYVWRWLIGAGNGMKITGVFLLHHTKRHRS